MKVYVFSHFKGKRTRVLSEKKVLSHLERIANDTDTQDLVVAVYLLSEATQTRGTAYVHWMTSENFVTSRGHWRFTQYYPTPSDLPSRFKLIRLRLDPWEGNYPKTEMDSYFWKFHYTSFWDQLALLFAHELHHFRRHHLGLHPHEGEHSANRWALHHVQNLGYRVSAMRIVSPRKKMRRFFKQRTDFDSYVEFRNLKPGAWLCIVHDPKAKYTGQWVRLVRPVRKGARRAVVETLDGKKWRWPLAWLKRQPEGIPSLDFSERLF